MAESHDRSDARREEEAMVPADDAVIGRAFRWSLAVIVVLAVGAATAWWLLRPPKGGPVIVEKDPGAIETLQSDDDRVPDLPFADVTAAAGIAFVHHSGATGQKLLPETMGAGAAFLDYDDDGDQDLLLVNGSSWPWDEAPVPPPTCALYRNDGGAFTDVTAEAGLDVTLFGMGVACGDYDGDGRVDVYLTAVGANRLLRNVGGRFRDVTETAGVGGEADRWSTSAAFFDADGDEDLDLFVCNYVRWSREIDLNLNYTLNGVDRAYGPPTSFRGEHCTLYRNRGDGTFADVSAEAGLQIFNVATGVPVGKALALVPADLTGDGRLDVIVANDTTRNFLFVNRGDGTFAESGVRSGVAFDGMGQATGAMGIDAARYRNDEDLAVGIGNFANQMTSFYVKQAGSGVFSDDAIVEGIGSPSRIVLSFGLFFFDADLDGRLDLLQANGHLEEAINQLQPSQHYRQRTQLFWNRGPDAPAAFLEVPPERTGDLAVPIVGRGAAYADVDGDGDLDVVLTQTGGPARLLRNTQSSGHHWLRVRLVGRPPNTGAIGASVELSAGGSTQRRVVMPARSYLSQVELPVTFGLGEAGRVDALAVLWPDGTRQQVMVPAVDREIVVRREAAAGAP
ncbi:MAG: CRTAC1 family protein [Planctomycetota bacterium]|jgi:hypothetical protein